MGLKLRLFKYIVNGLFLLLCRLEKMFIQSEPFSNSHIFSSQLSQAIYSAHPLGSVGGKA